MALHLQANRQQLAILWSAVRNKPQVEVEYVPGYTVTLFYFQGRKGRVVMSCDNTGVAYNIRDKLAVCSELFGCIGQEYRKTCGSRCIYALCLHNPNSEHILNFFFAYATTYVRCYGPWYNSVGFSLYGACSTW